MHPIDVKSRDRENPTPAGRSGWWVLFGLMLALALVVALLIGLSDGANAPQENVPTEAPVDPGVGDNPGLGDQGPGHPGLDG